MNRRERPPRPGRPHVASPLDLPEHLKRRESLLRAELEALEREQAAPSFNRPPTPPSPQPPRSDSFEFRDEFPSANFRDNLPEPEEGHRHRASVSRSRPSPHFRRFLLLCAIFASVMLWFWWKR